MNDPKDHENFGDALFDAIGEVLRQVLLGSAAELIYRHVEIHYQAQRARVRIARLPAAVGGPRRHHHRRI